MITHDLGRMSYPKVFLHLAKVPDNLVAPAHSHVVERANDNGQTRTTCYRLKRSVQVPTCLLVVFDHKFVLLRFVQRIVLLQFSPQFSKQRNHSLPMSLVPFCFRRPNQKSVFRPVDVCPSQLLQFRSVVISEIANRQSSPMQ